MRSRATTLQPAMALVEEQISTTAFTPSISAVMRWSSGEQRPEGNVGKSALHALIGGAVLAQHHGFVLLCHVHQVLHVVFIVGPQGRVLNAGRSLFQHCRLAGGIVNGQAMGSFVFGHLQHSSHPPLKQRSQLGIHRVDLGARLFQSFNKAERAG